ncbi:serine/threonine protein kinase [bacterium]|nr:serine/threonine protein kinase [bacterium]MBP9810193.1 serine/threonine protein kinase [bacterium]
MTEARDKLLPTVSHQTPNVLDQSDVIAFMPNADFFLWFTPVVSRLAIVIALTPMFLFLLGYLGILDKIVFPITIVYINSLKPFLQLAVSAEFAPMLDGMTNLLYLTFGLLGLGVAAMTIRILSNSNSLCLTAKGISLGNASSISGNSNLVTTSGLSNHSGFGNNSGLLSSSSNGSPTGTSNGSDSRISKAAEPAGASSSTSSSITRGQVIYQERDELDFKQVTSIEITRPKTTRSNLDYVFVFHRGLLPAFKIRYGDILKAKDRAVFVAAIKKSFGDKIDDELLEPFEIADEKQSYTELWLKELSASPKRDKLTPLELGATLHNGRYTIISRIGMGGQGTVYLAQDHGAAKNQATAHKVEAKASKAFKEVELKDAGQQDVSQKEEEEEGLKEVVLKEFLLPVFPDTRVRKAAAIKFQEEADLLGKLQHPQIVKFYELFLEDHRAYLVLEKLDGVTLKEYVESKGRLPSQTIEDLARQMCLILQYLHNQTPPVVHRDFTPDNLVLGDDGKLKLLDFSVAQSVTSNVTGSVVGKPHYIAPEQFRGKSCSQSDIYSMGATLYFLATGKQPEPITNSKLAAENSSLSSDSKFVTNCKSSNKLNTILTTVIEKSTKLDLGNRYKNAEEILHDLG